MEENFLLDLVGCLEQNKSQKQVNNDLKKLEKTINMLRLTATLAKGSTKKELNAYIKSLQSQLNYVKLTAKVDSKKLKSEIDSALKGIKFKDIDALNIDENRIKLKIQKAIADAKAYAEKNPVLLGVNIESRKSKLGNDLTAYLNRNTKISESGVLLQEADKVRKLIDAINDKKSLREATDAFQLYKSEVSATGFASKSTADKIKNMIGHITKIGSAFGVASMAVNGFVKSLSTLRSNDTILTEILKTSELTKKQLQELGDEAFNVAGKFGQLSSNYLLAVQEMARSGYEETSKELGELSLLAQSAGDMTAENANNYLLATDAAYKYSGSVEKLNAALDGANYISNRNSASLTDIADATRVSASFAANAGVAIDELTAAEAAMIAATKRSGSEMGRAFRSIILNLQQVSGEFDGEIIDEEQLKKVESRCHSLGVELEYMKDGIATLRNPIEVLKDLAEVYNSLPDNSAEKQGLISDLGGKYHANALSALLSRWDMYEKMLSEFSQGTGSALEEAEKTADSWEGRLNSLQNSWDSFINTLTNKEAVMGGISFFDRLIQGAEALTDSIGEIPVVLTTLNTAMVAMKKDYGVTKIWDKENQKFDIEGNIFGIDFSTIKEQKKHFSQASEEIEYWNKELCNGKADLDSFSGSLVKSNAQFKAYLQTTSKDAPASLNGYRQYLQQTGQATEALRIKTILLNAALTMLGSIAVQAVITGIAEAFDKFNETVEESKEKVNDINSKISGLESQIEELNNLEYKSDFDKQKIAQLERELELQEKILEIEQKRLYQNQIGTKFSDYFDKDSLVAKQQAENDRNNQDRFSNLSRLARTYESSLADINAELDSLQDKLNSEELTGHDRFVTEGKIAGLTEKRNTLLEKQQTVEDKLTLNMGEYLKNYQIAQEAADSGLLTGSDLEKAESMAEYWNQMYQDSLRIVTNIQKMNGTYEENTSTKFQKSIKKLVDDHGFADRKQIAELNEYTKDFTESEKELWLEATQGAKNATEAIKMYETALANVNNPSVNDPLKFNTENFSGVIDGLSSIQSLYGDFKEKVDEGVDFTFDFSDIEGLRDTFTDLGVPTEQFDAFEEALSSSSTTASEAQAQFNAMAASLIYSTGCLDGLNSSNRDLIVSQLELQGIVNASSVVTEELAMASEVLAQNGYSLADAADAAYWSILNEAGASEATKASLYALNAAEIAYSNNGFSTQEKISQLGQLAKEYGDTATAAIAAAAAKRVANGHGDYESVFADMMASVNRSVQSVKIELPEVDARNAKSSASKAGKDVGKSYKDALKEELSDLDNVISGITSRIDDQISSVNEQKSAALESIDEQKEALEEAKDAAVDALEAERDARLEVIETQRKQIEQDIEKKQKIIDGIQDEIDAMREANEERQREIDLQKAKYELERMKNQRTKLVYSSDKGIHYVNDSQGIFDARGQVRQIELEIEIANKEKQIDLIEKEIDKLNESLDLLDEQEDQVNEHYDQLIKQTEAFYDSQIKALEKQRKETEKYYESITNGLEAQKSKFQELTELLEKAELSAKLKQLGIDEEALLNGSEEEFEKLKNAYLNIVFQLNEGNDEVLEKLRELSGYDGTAPAMLSDSNEEIDTMNSSLATSNTNVGAVNTSLGETASKTDTVADNVGTASDNVSSLNSNLSESNSLVSEEQASFNNLKQTIDEVIESINRKIEAVQAGQNAVATATGSEIANLELLKNKIIEVRETIGTVNDTVSAMDRQPVDNLTNAFLLLHNQILLVSNTLGDGIDNGIASAINALNEISLEEGIIAQFTNLKTAIDSVTAAISGGGSSESSGSEGQSGSSGSGKGSESGGKGSKGNGEGEGGGSDSLTGAIREMGDTANKVIGEPDAEGDGTVIGEFGSMETAVNDVRDAIGTESSEGGEGGSPGGENDDTLVGSIEYLGDKTEEEMGEPDGDGIIGKFTEFKNVIEEAANHVKSISEGLDEIDGKEVECTITVNVKMNGSIPAFASGTVLGNMQIESATYNAKYGKAFASGTIGLKHDEKNALRSEYGQPEITVYPDGTTELTTSPVMGDLPKGTVIYNEEQTKKIMDNKVDVSGSAHANGTADSAKSTVPAEPPAFLNYWDRITKCAEALGRNVEDLLNPLNSIALDIKKETGMGRLLESINNVNNVTNNKNIQKPVTIQIGDINLTGVQDEVGLAHAIKTHLPGKMMQEYFKN